MLSLTDAISANTASAPFPSPVMAPKIYDRTIAAADEARSQSTEVSPILFIFSLLFKEIKPDMIEIRITGATRAVITLM